MQASFGARTNAVVAAIQLARKDASSRPVQRVTRDVRYRCYCTIAIREGPEGEGKQVVSL